VLRGRCSAVGGEAGHRARRRRGPRGNDPQTGLGRVGPIPRPRAGLVDRAPPGRPVGRRRCEAEHLPAREPADRGAEGVGRHVQLVDPPPPLQPLPPRGHVGRGIGADGVDHLVLPVGWGGEVGWNEEGVHGGVRAAAGVAHRGPPGLPGPAELDHVADHRTGPAPGADARQPGATRRRRRSGSADPRAGGTGRPQRRRPGQAVADGAGPPGRPQMP
jgi:hypothetical protein